MGDLKPLGSEKLSGDDKLKRILELTYYNTNKKSNSNNKPETIKESTNGTVYGIVKEKDGYYVKKGINESSLDYIGGLFMKNKNKFSSYAEALKRLQLLSGQDNLQEATKYVLKQKSDSTDTPAPDMGGVPAPEAGGAPAPDMGGSPAPEAGGEPAPDMGGDMEGGEIEPPPTGDSGMEGEEGKRSDYMSEIQKYSGKLGQELRDQGEKLKSDDLKYVLNMIISAIDLDILDDEDREEIAGKFEKEEEQEGSEEGSPEPEPSAEEEPSAEPEPSPDNELGEIMSKLNNFINSKAPQENKPKQQNEINLSDYSDLGGGTKNEEENIQELDLDEIKNQINKSIGETLSKYFK